MKGRSYIRPMDSSKAFWLLRQRLNLAILWSDTERESFRSWTRFNCFHDRVSFNAPFKTEAWWKCERILTFHSTNGYLSVTSLVQGRSIALDDERNEWNGNCQISAKAFQFLVPNLHLRVQGILSRDSSLLPKEFGIQSEQKSFTCNLNFIFGTKVSWSDRDASNWMHEK